MIRIGYVDGQRISIKQYNPQSHKGMVKCAQGHTLVAKCGQQRQHHFCHKAGDGDDNCGAGMGDWHLWWQNRIKFENTELRFNKDILKIADAVNIVDDNLCIIEFQKSKMSKEEMKLREKFYTRRDLMAEWGVKDCPSVLNWIFHLLNCDIEIEHIFGDVICFKWVKGPKFMCYSKCDGGVTTYYDLGKRDLIQIYQVHKPNIINTKFIGRVIPLSEIDKLLFNGILLPDISSSNMRMDCHKILNTTKQLTDKKRKLIVEKCKLFYFDENISIDKTHITKLMNDET